MLAAVVVVPLSGAMARASPLDNAAISELIAGTTVHIDTPIGVPLPIEFHRNGTMSGTAGRLEFVLHAPRDRGRWWVADNKLCQKWFRWFDAQVQCITLRGEGNRYHWRRDDGTRGTASVVARAEAPVVVAAKAAATAVATAVSEALKPEPVRPSGLGLKVEVPQKVEGAVAITPEASEASRVLASAPPPTSSQIGIGNATAARVPPSRAVLSPARVETAFVAPHELARRGITYRVVNVPEGDSLNIRERASAEAPIAGRIPAHARGLITYGDCSGNWCPVRFGAVTGWVHRAYIALEPMSGMASNQQVPGFMARR